MKLLSFDIEISDVFELGQHEDMEKYAPFHISVAATAIHHGEERVWYSEGADGVPALNLTAEKAHELLEYLDEMQQDGYMICAWNGLGFDLKWLGHNARDMGLAGKIARRCYDPMFQFFNHTGYPVGLAKVAEAMGIAQRKLMDGADAPKRWHAGEHQAVMEYVLGDCQMTNQIVMAIQDAGHIRWMTTKGYPKSVAMRELKCVDEVLQEPAPDQSWLTNPLPKAKFHSWLITG